MADPSKDVDMSEEVKGLSVNVQKLRFMQKATEEKDRKELERRQLKALEKARWCVPGMEEEAKQTADVISDVEKAPAIRPVMGRRSYGGFNPTVEQFMREIAAQKATLKQEEQEMADLAALHALGNRSKAAAAKSQF